MPSLKRNIRMALGRPLNRAPTVCNQLLLQCLAGGCRQSGTWLGTNERGCSAGGRRSLQRQGMRARLHRWLLVAATYALGLLVTLLVARHPMQSGVIKKESGAVCRGWSIKGLCTHAIPVGAHSCRAHEAGPCAQVHRQFARGRVYGSGQWHLRLCTPPAFSGCAQAQTWGGMSLHAVTSEQLHPRRRRLKLHAPRGNRKKVGSAQGGRRR